MCSVTPLANGVFFAFFFRQIFGRLFLGGHLGLQESRIPVESNNHSLTGQQGLTEHVWKSSGSISEKRCENLCFVRKTYVICVVAL